MKKERNKEVDELNSAIESLANYVSSDSSEAEEFLKEEGVDAGALKVQGHEFIRRLQAKARLKLGQNQESRFMIMIQRFSEALLKNPDMISSDINSLNLQVNYRGFESMTEDEKARLARNDAFMKYLEDHFSEDNGDGQNT